MSRSSSLRGAGTAIALLLLAGPSFAASPAPKPSASEVEAWSRLVDAAFPADELKGQALPTTYALTGLAALREGKPALGEACFRKAYAAAPEYEAEGGDLYLRAAIEISRNPERRVALAPFILLYLDLAEAKGSKGMVSQARDVKSLRAELAAVKSPPPARESPSIESLSEVAAASERWVRGEIARARYRRTSGDLREMGIAFAAYALEHYSLYPAGNLDAIERRISPAYMALFPRLDGWGAPYRVETSTDRKHYRIVSAGADGSFEVLAPLGAAVRPPQRTVDDARGDIVFEDGKLVQEWSEKAFEVTREASTSVDP